MLKNIKFKTKLRLFKKYFWGIFGIADINHEFVTSGDTLRIFFYNIFLDIFKTFEIKKKNCLLCFLKLNP